MNSRSCDVMSSAPVRDFRKSSSQMIDSMSRWFVGSSISSTSGSPSSTRAIATRIFQPPDSAPTSPSIRSSSNPRPCRISRVRALERVAAEVLVFLLHFAEAREDRVHLVGPRRIAHRVLEMLRARGAGRRARPLPAIASSSTDRPGHLLDVLAEVADRQLLRDRHVAFVGRFFAGDHAEQRRLAGAVRADEADFLAGIELERGVDEENLAAVLLADFGERDHLGRYSGYVSSPTVIRCDRRRSANAHLSHSSTSGSRLRDNVANDVPIQISYL